jgi:hypothetical protein
VFIVKKFGPRGNAYPQPGYALKGLFQTAVLKAVFKLRIKKSNPLDELLFLFL